MATRVRYDSVTCPNGHEVVRVVADVVALGRPEQTRSKCGLAVGVGEYGCRTHSGPPACQEKTG